MIYQITETSHLISIQHKANYKNRRKIDIPSFILMIVVCFTVSTELPSFKQILYGLCLKIIYENTRSDILDILRAQEILQTKDTVNVYYHNKSVWINSINEKHNTVHVKDVATDKVMNVNAHDLEER